MRKNELFHSFFALTDLKYFKAFEMIHHLSDEYLMYINTKNTVVLPVY
jgi:hypothetical protein